MPLAMHCGARLRFLPPELCTHLAPEDVRVILRDGRRKRERDGSVLGPCWVARVEVDIGALRPQHAATELADEDLRPRPLPRTSHESRPHRIRQRIGDLLHDGRSCYKPDRARRFVTPYRALPCSDRLGSQRHEAVKELQKTREHSFYVRDDDVQVRGHGA
ncbi:hypothetical protein BE15_01660 [Sorangium cellulosum]|uniref:Uncharacterized protein n=1 Tax=Sorangium cellulosum TaxID=56 RepID=A0A150QE98_SORCE|nr:hypothetical protein BE15_01660 [Sorangium cellulosum]